MSDHDTQPTPGPYATAAPTYWQAGWRGVLPLPAGAKTPVPRGWTGAHGGWPSYADVHAWTEEQPGGNIALRLPPDVLGVDVDSYGDKPGGLVLASLEERLGALPATWRTTSRDDGTSGIRLYRIPPGLRWPGVLGPGIETIRFEHRYALAWPSVHPTGGTYRWITPDGATALGVVPTPEDLPTLPKRGSTTSPAGRPPPTSPTPTSPTPPPPTGSPPGAGAPCRHVDSALTAGLNGLTAATSRHDATLQLTNRLVWLAGEGHTGAAAALTQTRQAFTTVVAPTAANGRPPPSGTVWSPAPSASPPPPTPTPPRSTPATTRSTDSSHERTSHARARLRPHEHPSERPSDFGPPWPDGHDPDSNKCPDDEHRLNTCAWCVGSGVVDDFDGEQPCARCDGRGHLHN